MPPHLPDWIEALRAGVAGWGTVDAAPFAAARFPVRRVRTQYYGHGAFMGAAPALFADPLWRRILAFLMPDVFQETQGAEPPALMGMMENNPVLAAYGTLRCARSSTADESPNHLAGMEWDLFVDTALVRAHARATTPREREAVLERVVDTALIAHAGILDTIQESLGFSQYADVRATPKTAFGGVEMDSWLDLFGRALFLARTDDFDAAVREMAAEPRSASDEACMRFTFARPWPIERVVDEHARVTGRPFVSVIIDVKSLHSTPAFLSGVVEHLNRKGVHVAVVGSFLREEIDGVSRTAQYVGGRHLPGPREVLFFHFVGDLRAACRDGRVPYGHSVMFNGASLLEHGTTEAGQHHFTPRTAVLEGLDALRREHDLHVGFYVQEGDCEADAVAALSGIVDAWPDTFALGFAWGGLRDEAGLPPGPIARVGYGGQLFLFAVGKALPWELGS